MSELAYFSGLRRLLQHPGHRAGLQADDHRLPEHAGVFFTSGGAESNESAFKTARFYWKAQGKPDKVKVIARSLAYHGVTLQAMSATGMSRLLEDVRAARARLRPHPDVLSVPSEAPSRARPRGRPPRASSRRRSSAKGADTVAAFIAEPIHGAGGVIIPTDDYFPRVREDLRLATTCCFIADEVITGFCRTGKWFALEHWNVQPDIMSFAKGVTCGYLPLGGIMVSNAISRRWTA